jgi:hypothetical protein
MGKYMTRLYVFSILFLCLAALPVHRVFAEDKISDPGAMLAESVPAADPRIAKLRSFLKFHNSPAADDAAIFISEADKNNLDWKLVAAISGLESTFCQAIPSQSYNCWGWGIPTGAQSGIGFANFRDGIAQVSMGLRQNYIDRGYVTIEQIGSVYAASPTWAYRVRGFMNEIDAWQTAPSNAATVSLSVNI